MRADNEAMTPQTLSFEAPAFDDLAAAYDAVFTTSALGRNLRALTWERLDAVRLALRGVDVLATDPSPSMLRVAAEKAADAGCAKRIEFRCVPMERLGLELAGERFDGVWSNFGAINCVPKLDPVVAELAALLEPGAPLAWVVLGKDVP